MTGSSLDMKLFIQPFLPAEAAGCLFFLDASNGLYRPLPIIQIPNEDILANYFFASCQLHGLKSYSGSVKHICQM